MATLGSLVVSFFRNYLANQKGCSQNTIASYSDCITLLLRYCCKLLAISSDKLSMEMISDQLILGFLDHLEQERGNVPKTRNQRLGAIKTFFRFLALQEPTLLLVCERVCAISAKKVEHTVVATLDDNEIRVILGETETATLLGARDQALLALLYNTGARAQELVDLNLSDLRLEAPFQVLLTGKGRKERVVPLYEEAVTAIKHYMDLRQKAGIKHDALVLNDRGNRITRFGIEYVVGKYVGRAARKCLTLPEKNVTPHTFRHTLALHLIQSGVNIVVVKELLGHADIRTTHQYLDIDIEMKRKALEACPPPYVLRNDQPRKPNWLDPPVMTFLKDLSRQTGVMLS